MSRKVKNRKEVFKPIVKIGDKSCIVAWDYKPVTKINNKGIEVETPLAIWQEESFNFIPTIDFIKEMIYNYYNAMIEEEIICGFEWNGMKVWLTSENQFNYKSIYDLAIQNENGILPVTMKFGTTDKPTYYTFKKVDDLRNFYISCINHIQTTLKKGWQKKDDINWKNYELLK